ncbi:hypothetical protein [Celeribacter neptunius]|uniref:Uncharacterized protein n=1 Tax=Celeribacter neptunius TaxID=588602 RepID=A0A1I3UD19_9RHOB|nr:hypothetical protein [Celeribacter neptunius]SFJ80890.1 hypothetical protein SAMN04487991_2998 [Celeribacter neptunius]
MSLEKARARVRQHLLHMPESAVVQVMLRELEDIDDASVLEGRVSPDLPDAMHLCLACQNRLLQRVLSSKVVGPEMAHPNWSKEAHAEAFYLLAANAFLPLAFDLVPQLLAGTVDRQEQAVSAILKAVRRMPKTR